jgi:transposase
MPQGKQMSDETRIGACADYLLGKPTSEIEKKWQVSAATVSKWIRRTGSFKLRRSMGIRTSRGLCDDSRFQLRGSDDAQG